MRIDRHADMIDEIIRLGLPDGVVVGQATFPSSVFKQLIFHAGIQR